MDSRTALWDERQVAAHYNVSVRTVQRWRADGDGPAYIRLGVNCVRYSPDAIAAYSAGRSYTCRAEELAAA